MKWKIMMKENLRDFDDTPCLGICSNAKKIIYLERNMTKSEFLETLLHEYLHACFYEAGIDDANPNEVLEHFLINSVAKDMVVNSSFWKKIF